MVSLVTNLASLTSRTSMTVLIVGGMVSCTHDSLPLLEIVKSKPGGERHGQRWWQRLCSSPLPIQPFLPLNYAWSLFHGTLVPYVAVSGIAGPASLDRNKLIGVNAKPHFRVTWPCEGTSAVRPSSPALQTLNSASGVL